MYKRNNGRPSYKSGRRTSYKKTSGFQNYKVRNKGNISQQYNKYLKLAKESFRSGDRVQSEYYYQFTDHYYRLMLELGISFDENNHNEDSRQTNSEESSSDSIDPNPVDTQDNSEENSNNIDSQDNESLESISFIADNPKTKRTKSSK